MVLRKLVDYRSLVLILDISYFFNRFLVLLEELMCWPVYLCFFPFHHMQGIFYISIFLCILHITAYSWPWPKYENVEYISIEFCVYINLSSYLIWHCYANGSILLDFIEEENTALCGLQIYLNFQKLLLRGSCYCDVGQTE